MPRPVLDLNVYKDEILQLQSQSTIPEIIQYLQTTYNLSISVRTLQRRLKDWGSRTYTDSSDPTFLPRLRELFFHGMNDNEILRTLKAEGFTVTLGGLVRIRKEELDLYRRLITQEHQETSETIVRSKLIDELEHGIIDGYGRELLYAHFQQLKIPVARSRLFSIYRTLAPDAIDRRKRNMQRHRGEYIVPGPNFIWSVDGYLKLAPYGIEIYAAIDAYSRYVIWIYVGISGRTAISVLRQYLDTIQTLSQHPRFIRSDHGGETVLMASAHHQLQQIAEPDLQFQDCYMYGTSTTNQRIEAWWNQLSKGLLFRWRVCFFRTISFF